MKGLRTACVILLAISLLSAAGRWKEAKSEHFIISYRSGIPLDYIKEFTRKCERYYDLITKRLGFNRFDFWLWEKRAKIFIYKTKSNYLEATGRPEWSGASVHVKKRFINTFYFEKGFFDTILPHELTHIILREFIGLKTKTPLWFDEGVASANEKDSYLKYLLVVKGFAEKDIFLPAEDMDKISGREIRIPSLFYATAASMVIFLLEEYKQEDFVEFCRYLRDGMKFYAAMEKVYAIENAAGFNKKFQSFLKNKTYEDIVKNKSPDVEW